MSTDTLPGSEAAAKADEALKEARPTRDKLEAAQKSQAQHDKEEARIAVVETSKPSLGRIVHYIAPDRTSRVALITHVHPGDEEAPPGAEPDIEGPTGYVNLRVYGIDFSDNQLARQSALLPAGPGVYLGLTIPIEVPGKGSIHCWRWPPRV